MPLLLLFVAASAVGLAFQRLGVPGGAVVGSLIGAAGYSLLRGGAEVAVP